VTYVSFGNNKKYISLLLFKKDYISIFYRRCGIFSPLHHKFLAALKFYGIFVKKYENIAFKAPFNLFQFTQIYDLMSVNPKTRNNTTKYLRRVKKVFYSLKKGKKRTFVKSHVTNHKL